MTTKTALDVPLDPRWRHVIAATVLAAVRAYSAPPSGENPGSGGWGQGELGRMGDLSLLLDRAVDDIANLPGVTSLGVEVESGPQSVVVSVVGGGEDIERPHSDSSAPLTDPLTGSMFEWSQTEVVCSLKVAIGPL
ncbi:MAG TPA: hypothetical protein VJQ79_04355 [Acidimicrobiia bacterium]|nr:hypothetical protein [Acidimicrobiia bacterium]